MRRAVIDLHSSRPAWRLPPWSVRTIRDALGADWTVRRVTALSSSDGDGATGSPEAERAARGAEIYFGWGIPRGVARAGRGTLRWVHSAAAGVGASLTPELRRTGACFTNSRGIQAEPMADWIITAVGFCVRGFHLAVAAQRARRWAKDAFTDGTSRLREFAGTRVGIVGLGGVGAAVARRCIALGMEVRAVRRRPKRRAPPGVRWVGGPEDVLGLARYSDVLVIAAPHTGETRRLVNRRALRALPRGAYVINAARGALVDEAALVEALETERVAGCVLDVFEREPLPRHSSLWSHPGVLVFPHSSAVSDRFWERETRLMVDNVGRYLRGRPLKHVVDFEAGY